MFNFFHNLTGFYDKLRAMKQKRDNKVCSNCKRKFDYAEHARICEDWHHIFGKLTDEYSD